jgi:hypothetical protein
VFRARYTRGTEQQREYPETGVGDINGVLLPVINLANFPEERFWPTSGWPTIPELEFIVTGR